jgi:uncharacterized protein YcfJ
MSNEKKTIIVLSAILLVVTTAGASIYLAKPVQPEKIAVIQRHAPTSQHAVSSNCNDGNIAGKAVGGVGGGVLGSLIGKGNGKTAATIGGTLGGAYVGGETIPLNNVTCR